MPDGLSASRRGQLSRGLSDAVAQTMQGSPRQAWGFNRVGVLLTSRADGRRGQREATSTKPDGR